MENTLLVTPNDVVRFTAMNGNVDVDKFLPNILYAQDTHIQKYVGTNLLNKIIEDNDTLTTPYLELVDKFIKPMLLHWAFAEYLPFAAYTIANKGVYKHTSENAQNAEKNEVDFLTSKAISMAQNYTDRFIAHMRFYYTNFPEYIEYTADGLYPDNNSNFFGWVL